MKLKQLLKLVSCFLLMLSFVFILSGCSLFEGLVEDDDNNSDPASSTLIKNGDLNDGLTYWNVWDGNVSDNNTIIGVVENGELKINTTCPDFDVYSVGVANYGGITIETGRSYKVSFDARSSTSCKILAFLEENISPWHAYSSKGIFSLTSSMNTYTFQFTMNRASTPNSTFTFMFESGNHEVYIDNIHVEEITGSYDNFGDDLINGDFSEGTIGWVLTTSTIDHDADVNYSVQSGELVVDVVNGGSTLAAMQIRQCKIDLVQFYTYRISFDARCLVASNKNVYLNINGLHSETININTTMNTYSYDFYMNDPTSYGFIQVGLGTDNTDIVLDNFSVVKL